MRHLFLKMGTLFGSTFKFYCSCTSLPKPELCTPVGTSGSLRPFGPNTYTKNKK